LLPLLLLAGIVFVLSPAVVLAIGKNIFFFLLFVVLALMLIFFVFDWLFGLSVKRLTRGAVPFEKLQGKVMYYNELDSAFKDTLKRFNVSGVRLYVDQNAPVVNAYAIGGFRHKAIVLTQAFIAQVYTSAKRKEDPFDAMRGILGHEMSHLINKDFLPGMIIMTNQRVTDMVSGFVRLFFVFLTLFIRWVPVLGRLVSGLIMAVHNLIYTLLSLVQRLLVMPIYGFLKKWLSRGVEYRCDRQSAEAFGGQIVARGLAVLGEGSYFSLFSTHPRTASRIEKVQNIRFMNVSVKAELMTRLANFLALVLIVVLCRISWELADVALLQKYYHYYISGPIQEKWNWLNSFFN
jgi:Zn-dependent protease with chaperone function